MGQAKKRAKEILELKEYQDYMKKNFDCSDWFYEDGSVIKPDFLVREANSWIVFF